MFSRENEGIGRGGEWRLSRVKDLQNYIKQEGAKAFPCESHLGLLTGSHPR